MSSGELRFTSMHEWARVKKGKIVLAGISDYAQSLLSDITSVELPEPDDQCYEAGEEVGVIESLKSSMPFHAPTSGTISAVNRELLSNPELINQDPYGEGWLIEMHASNVADLKNLVDQDEYESGLPEEEEE